MLKWLVWIKCQWMLVGTDGVVSNYVSLLWKEELEVRFVYFLSNQIEGSVIEYTL